MSWTQLGVYVIFIYTIEFAMTNNLFIQSTDGITPVGSESTVCVQSEASFGVVCLDKHIHCVTCKYGTTSCTHVKYIQQAIASNGLDGSGAILKSFSDFLHNSPMNTVVKPDFKELTTNCKSTIPIPFEFPSPLKSVLRMAPHSRFSIGDDDTANLSPVLSTSRKCPLCDSTGTWSDVTFFNNEAILITNNQSIKAKGNNYFNL